MAIVDELLDDIARKHCGPSGTPATDYRLAQILGVSKQSMSNYRNHFTSFDDDVAVRIASEAGFDPAYVLAMLHAQRAKDKAARNTWLRIARAFPATVCVALGIGIVAAAVPSPSQANQTPSGADGQTTVYYVK